MNKLKQEFKTGFQEGWRGIWSPFTGLYQSIRATWKAHVNLRYVSKHWHA